MMMMMMMMMLMLMMMMMMRRRVGAPAVDTGGGDARQWRWSPVLTAPQFSVEDLLTPLLT